MTSLIYARSKHTSDSSSTKAVSCALRVEVDRLSTHEVIPARTSHIATLSSLGKMFGTSPELSMLLMSSTKDSLIICVSENKKVTGMLQRPVVCTQGGRRSGCTHSCVRLCIRGARGPTLTTAGLSPPTLWFSSDPVGFILILLWVHGVGPWPSTNASTQEDIPPSEAIRGTRPRRSQPKKRVG